MAISDFYPFQDNQKVTAAQWNELLDAVADGSFFTDATFIGAQISTLEARVTALEAQMASLSDLGVKQRKRQQFVLTAGQDTVVLDDVPLIDSETVSLNGLIWAKTGIPSGFIGDYSITNKTLGINPQQAMNLQAGDVLVVTYEFEVE